MMTFITARAICYWIWRSALSPWLWTPSELWDRAGLQLGDPRQAVRRAMLCIDLTEPVLDEAIERRAELVVAYHPLIFEPLEAEPPQGGTTGFGADGRWRAVKRRATTAPAGKGNLHGAALSESD